MAYRSSTGELGFHDEPVRRPGGGERWDREKFERSRRARDDHDHFHFEDHDHKGRHHHDIEIDARFDRDRRGNRVVERERFHEDDRFSERGSDRDRFRRPRTEIFDDHTPSEIANRALAPYRRKSIVEKDVQIAVKRPGRPQFLRRTSSLDTFDRRPQRRFAEHEHERDEWRPPTNVPIPLPIRERRRSPSRRRIIREEEYEDVRYPEPREEYREVEVRRERSTRRRSQSKRRVSVARSTRSSSLSSFEEIEPPKPIGKKGKTRMPKRLVKKQAIIELGYPFEEEDDFIIVRVALEKEQIDEVIRISENYKEERTTYVFEDKQEYAPPPPPPAEHYIVHPAPPPSQSVHYAQSVRSASPSRHEASFEERLEESNHISGPLTVLVPNEKHGQRIIRDRDVKEEIRQLDEERRMLKYERDTDYEFVERREPRREVVRIDKDRKARRPPNPKVVAAMMATLT